MFTVERRDLVRDWLLDRARADNRITGAAVTGSAALGAEDRWSDVDLFLGVQNDIPVEDVVTDWSSLVYTEFDAVHHFDLRGGPAATRRQ